MSRNLIVPPSYGRRPVVGLTGGSAAQALASAIKAILAPDVMLIGDLGILDAGGAPIATGVKAKTWTDQSGNARNAIQNTVANQPTYETDAVGLTGLTPSRGFLSNFAGSDILYMEGPLVNNGTTGTVISVGFEFSGGPWVGACLGATGVTDIAADKWRCYDNNGGSNVRSLQNATTTATVAEAGVKRSIYRAQLTGANLVIDVDGNIASVASTPTLATSIYGIFNNPILTGSDAGDLWLLYFHGIWNANMSGGNFASISTLLKNYYNTT